MLYLRHLLASVVLASFQWVAAVATTTITVNVPSVAPTKAAALDKALLSFSLEQDRWPDWAGRDAPNEFLLSALANLADRTGNPPWIRIGADSEDHTDFSFNVDIEEAIFPASSSTTPFSEASNITAGAGFYKLASHLPADTQVIWGVNLGTDNLTAAFLESRAIKEAFDDIGNGITLRSVEIGNEPDLYGNNGHRNAANWTVATYVDQWSAFAENVSVAAGVSSATSAPKFFGCAFADSSHSTSSFSPQGAFAAGLLESNVGTLIEEISQHKYSGSGIAGVATLPTLINKASIRANLSEFIPDIAAVHAQGLEYVFGETNSYFDHGAPGVSDAGGAALWALDYTLFAATLGIKRLHFHEGVGYRYNFIQPVSLTVDPDTGAALPTPLEPHVQPAYYGALIVNEVVGTAGSSSLSELSINDAALAGYAAFEDGTLKRVVLIDSVPFLSNQGQDRENGRPAKQVLLNVGNNSSTAEIRRLYMAHTDVESGLTWAGQSFDTPGTASPLGQVNSTTVDIENGQVEVQISASEAVLISIQ